MLSDRKDGAGGSGHRALTSVSETLLHHSLSYFLSPCPIRHHSKTQHSSLHRLRIQPGDEAVITIKYPGSTTSIAALRLLSGSLIVAASAYPLVDVVDELSTESSIPSFFISFVVTPFACYSWSWSALRLAGKRKPRILSLVLSEVL